MAFPSSPTDNVPLLRVYLYILGEGQVSERNRKRRVVCCKVPTEGMREERECIRDVLRDVCIKKVDLLLVSYKRASTFHRRRWEGILLE